MDALNFRQAVMLIQMEYVEMAGLCLTLRQAARLWAMPIETCTAVFDTLVVAGFLLETRDGAYGRSGTRPVHVDSVDSLTWAVSPHSSLPLLDAC